MNWRLGLDLGTNSIGWAVLNLDADKHPESLKNIGVRIFSDGREPKTGEPLAVARRTARGIRKNLRRRKQRRRKLYCQLQQDGLFPINREDAVLLKVMNPYELRIKALDEKLEAYELGRVLFHLGVRRGFKSNRKDATDETSNQDDNETESDKIIELDPVKMKQRQKCLHLAETIEKSGYRTLGEFLWKNQIHNEGIRFVSERTIYYPVRQLYEEEFEAICTKQKNFYPAIDWDEIQHCIFHQRPLRAQERGKCQFMTDTERTFKALPCSHKYRILQEVSNLIWYDELNKPVPLEKEKQHILIDALNSKKEMTFDQIRKLLKIDGCFNLESEIRPKLNGNTTAVNLRSDKKFGSLWDELSLEEQDGIVEKLITANEDVEVLSMLEKYPLKDEQKQSITKASFSSGTTSFCKELTEKLIFEMQDKHIQFDKALILLGYDHFDDSVEKYDILPYYGQVLVGATMGGNADQNEKNLEKRYGKIGNPTVHVALNQTRVVVNALIKEYGKPSQIVVELSRDLKASRDDKEKMRKKQAEKARTNQLLNKDIMDMVKTIQYPGRVERRKFKLWEELGTGSLSRRCLYCGKSISGSELFTKNIEIEHILPYSRTLLDSETNLTVAHAHCNAKKREQTPYEAFGKNTSGQYAWDEIMERVRLLKSPVKKARFASDAMDKFSAENGFITRQLNDNRYLSKAARKYLTCLMEKNSEVWVIPGGMTKMLRDTWNIDSILKRKIAETEAVQFNLKDEDIGNFRKNRYDHRHHALDAITIALVDRSLMQEISTLNAKKQKERIEFPELPFVRADIIEKVKNIVVSFKPDHGAEGKLSKETLLGRIKQEESVSIKDLTEKDVECIKNERVQSEFAEMIAEKGSFVKAKKALQDIYPQIKIFRKHFVNRTPIASLKAEKNIADIIDLVIREKLHRFTASRSGQKFESILADFSKETGIKKIRCKTRIQKPIEIKANPKYPLSITRYLNPEDYFAAIIWQIPPEKDGKPPKYEAQFIRRTEIKDKKAIENKPHPAAKNICQLHKNDYIEFAENGVWKKARVAGYSATRNQIDIRPIFATNTMDAWIIATNEDVLEKGWKQQTGCNFVSVNALFGASSARKITVSPIGKVRRK